MNILFGGGGGFAAQGSDPKLGDKLAALKQKRGNLDDKVTDFLTREIGVDPDTLPFTPIQAREWLTGAMEAEDGDSLTIYGTSMDLQRIVIEVPDDQPVILTEDSPVWHDALRAYDALVKEHPERFKFRVERSYPTPTVEALEAPPVRSSDPLAYPSGAILRIQREVVQGDTLNVECEYIRIGGLFDEATPTILDTMQPITDLTGWSVIEELQ